MSVESRLKRIEKKLIPDEEDEESFVPVVIVCWGSGNHRGKGVVVIGGDSEKQGNEEDTIETD